MTLVLGDAVRDEWDLDPAFLTVNHGSFGAVPRVVLEAQQEWRARMEAQPTRFMGRILPDALRAAASALAAFLGASGNDLAFVENTTAGCNAVLRSQILAPDDEILVLSHGYGAVRNTVRHVAGRAGARVIEAVVPFPVATPDDIVASIAAALTPRTRLAVIDHITSHSALVLPVAEIVAVCRAAGVPVLVDGAHAPAHIALDLDALGADWYVGNCHKWLMAPKGSAFLHARADRQRDLHPAVISHGYGQGFLAEFDWTGTFDPSAQLAVPAALAFHHRLGGSALMARNAKLAAEAATLVAARLGTEAVEGAMAAGAMRLVRLPVAGVADAPRALALRQRLLTAGTDAPVQALAGRMWLRLSAQAYNTLADYERLAELVGRVLREAA